MISFNNPSIDGMSGGPILCKDADEWKVFGILVEGHHKLLSIIQRFALVILVIFKMRLIICHY